MRSNNNNKDNVYDVDTMVQPYVAIGHLIHPMNIGQRYAVTDLQTTPINYGQFNTDRRLN